MVENLDLIPLLFVFHAKQLENFFIKTPIYVLNVKLSNSLFRSRLLI